MTRWDWFFTALCLALMVLNVAQGDALMAAVSAIGVGAALPTIARELDR